MLIENVELLYYTKAFTLYSNDFPRSLNIFYRGMFTAGALKIKT